MRGVSPDDKDLDDITLAIRSFNGWGSVDPWGNYNPSLNGVTLYIMFKLGFNRCKNIVEDFAPPQYASRWPSESDEVEGTFHALATKVKVGLIGRAWILKATFIMGDYEHPIGFLAASSQSAVWNQLHRILNEDASQTKFCVTTEEAIALIP